MAASYPTSAKSFSTKATTDTVEASHVNDLQDEVNALETALLTSGVAHALFPSTSGTRDLGTSSLLFRTAYLDTALVLGAATTAGVRLDLESGVLAVREGNDSAYGALKALTLEATSNATVGGTLGVTGATTLSAGVAATGGAVSLNAGTNNFRLVGGAAGTRFFPFIASERTISGMTELGNLLLGSSASFEPLAGIEWYADSSASASANSKMRLFVRQAGIQSLFTIDGSATTAEITWPGAVVLGGATGGNKGLGTVNAKAVYDDDVLLTDWVFDLHYDGTTAHRVPEGGRLYAFEETMASTKADRRLPWMPTRDTFEQERSLGGMISRLWFGQEQQQIYLAQHKDSTQELAEIVDDHEDRIAALEARFGRAA